MYRKSYRALLVCNAFLVEIETAWLADSRFSTNEYLFRTFPFPYLAEQLGPSWIRPADACASPSHPRTTFGSRRRDHGTDRHRQDSGLSSPAAGEDLQRPAE